MDNCNIYQRLCWRERRQIVSSKTEREKWFCQHTLHKLLQNKLASETYIYLWNTCDAWSAKTRLDFWLFINKRTPSILIMLGFQLWSYRHTEPQMISCQQLLWFTWPSLIYTNKKRKIVYKFAETFAYNLWKPTPEIIICHPPTN